MKHTILPSLAALAFTGTLFATPPSLAQGSAVTETVITSDGTITELGAQSLMINTGTGSQPVRYISTEPMRYVDESGNTVAVTSMQAGAPVRVYYTKVGDTLVASKVMTRKVTTGSAGSPAVVESVESTTTSGVISEFGTDRILVRTAPGSDPSRYSYTSTTTYVDETGAPVTLSAVKSGLPVTVYYSKAGDAMTATKVVIRKAAAVAPVIEEKSTTTTTTTSDK